jgi:TonB-dependent receptor
MKHMPLRTGLSLAISALLAPMVAFAQAAPEAAPPASSQPAELDAVLVRGEYIPEPMLQTPEVATFVTREDFERTGDGNAAEALTRVSGLSLVNGKFVYVRGLGERYSLALLNGSPLPSPEPLQRVVPLDLFPSEVLQGVTVQKTYSARYPGEFGGGVIDLQSLAVPEENFFKLSVGIGGNSVTTGENGLTYYGGDDDWWGYDDGTRKIPAELRAALATGNRVDQGANFNQEEIRTIGRSINNPNLYLLQQKNSIDPDVGFGGSLGYGWDMGGNVRLGVVAVASFKNEWRTRFGQQQDAFFTSSDNVEFDSSYDFLSTRNQARTNAMFSTGLKGERHQAGWTTLYVHDTVKEARSRTGRDELAGFVARDDYTEWFERSLLSHQFGGSHVFGEFDDLKVEWRGAVAKATRQAPYETGIRYEDVDGFWSHDGSRVQNYFRFSEVVDRTESAGVDLTWRLPVERDLTLSGGASYSDNDRDSWSREFRLLALDGALPFYNRFQRIDYLFSDFNLSQGLLRLRETTGNSGAAAYTGELKVEAFYLQLEGEVVPTVRAAVGVRHEDATQFVAPYDIFTGTPEPAPQALEESYLLPSATVTWNFAENMQIRFGASETIARPQFRELSPQQYQDPDNNRLFYGNPFLVDSRLRNFDARWEWFFGAGEYVTAGIFYKNIDKPIEANINQAGGTTFQSYFNAPEANVYGVELDMKKYFALPVQAAWWGDSRLYVAANYTWSDSEVRASESDTVLPYGYSEPLPARLFVRDGSKLQGQSEHIANLQLGVESTDQRLQATLIANHVSDRISARGRPGQPDYLEDPGTTLDFVLRKGMDFGSRYKTTVSFAARNLLDTRYREYQERGGERVDVYTYKPGVSYDVSLSVEF